MKSYLEDVKSELENYMKENGDRFPIPNTTALKPWLAWCDSIAEDTTAQDECCGTEDFPFCMDEGFAVDCIRKDEDIVLEAIEEAGIGIGDVFIHGPAVIDTIARRYVWDNAVYSYMEDTMLAHNAL